MAVKRTGIVYTAPLGRRPNRAGGKKSSSALGILGNILETIGRPFYWALAGVFVALTYSFLTTGRFVFWLFQKLLKVIGLFGKLTPKFFSFTLSLSSSFFSRFWYSLTRFLPIIRYLLRFISRFLSCLWRSILRLLRLKIALPKIRKRWLFVFASLCFLALICFSTYWYILKDLPHPDKLATQDSIVSTKIYDRDGQLLYKIYRNQNRTLVKLEEIPMSLIQATIAIEDAEFYQHPGLSFKGIFRAFLKNLKGGKLYGGSTITQQLVKNALLTSERTLQRKIKELVLALWVEQKFSKDEILQMYFNEVGYGGAAYGAEEASQMYFGKSVRNLNLAEATLLAGLPASPTTYSPFGAHPEKAKERQSLVLQRMVEEKFITRQEGQKIKEQELAFASQRTDIKAPHFVMYVKELLVQKYGQRMVEEGGLEVTTSLDLRIQEMAQKIVSQEIEKIKNLNISNGAALVTNPQTGEVLAMVGSRDYFAASAKKQGSAEQSEAGSYFDSFHDGNVNVTLRPRQPGSSIKPVMYSLALQTGFTAATIIPDTPITYNVPGQPPYSPRNYDSRFHGNVPLRTALASSYNVPAVKVLSALGVKRMIDQGQTMGITTWEDPSRFGLSLTLGGGEVKMVDLAVAYGTLANLGTRVDLNPILEVKNFKGKILEATKNQEQKTKNIIDPRIAYILTDILSDNSARTPAFGPNSLLNIPGHPHVAAKTGTTQNLRDNWTIGYTPDYLVSVWVGNNDNTPMSYVASGVTGASPIWNQIMTTLTKDLPDKEFTRPEDLVRIEICAPTGTLPCEGCGGKWEYFLPGTEPKIHCQTKKEEESSKPKKAIESQNIVVPQVVNYHRFD